MILATFGQWAFVIALALGTLILLLFIVGSRQDSKRDADDNGASKTNGNSANRGEES
jgi:glucose uptake protein GlcU